MSKKHPGDHWDIERAERDGRTRARKQEKAEREHLPPRVELDREQLLAELQSPDEATRARAAREACPCRAGFEQFEQAMDLVQKLQKDDSPLVRGAALHVFEDAFEMQSRGLPTTPQAITNEMVATKRRHRGGSEETAPEPDEKWQRARERKLKRETSRRFGRRSP